MLRPCGASATAPTGRFFHSLLWEPGGQTVSPITPNVRVVSVLLVCVLCAQGSTAEGLSSTGGSSAAVSSDVGNRSSIDCHGWKVSQSLHSAVVRTAMSLQPQQPQHGSSAAVAARWDSTAHTAISGHCKPPLSFFASADLLAVPA
jgi:hypothetical protein